MQHKFGICVECGHKSSLNSRQQCPECTFKANHEGKSKQEVYKERSNERVESTSTAKPKEIYVFKRKSLKRSKNASKTNVEKEEKKKELIAKDEELYEYIFDTKPPYCEECGARLPDEFRDENGRVIMRSRFSHIMTKGAWKEFRHDKRNMNLLCDQCHHIWEFGDRKSMKIYERNQLIIQELLDERNKVDI